MKTTREYIFNEFKRSSNTYKSITNSEEMKANICYLFIQRHLEQGCIFLFID